MRDAKEVAKRILRMAFTLPEVTDLIEQDRREVRAEERAQVIEDLCTHLLNHARLWPGNVKWCERATNWLREISQRPEPRGEADA